MFFVAFHMPLLMAGGNTIPSICRLIDGTLGTVTFDNEFPVPSREHASQQPMEVITQQIYK